MRRRLRSTREYLVAGWTLRVSNPAMMGDRWAAERDGARTRYYHTLSDTLSDARRAARAAGPTGEISGGVGFI